jgi:UDP-glucose 4-epimerase
MQALITGANGFLGAALVKELLKEKHQVRILIRHHADLFRLKDVLSQITVYYYDEPILESIDVIYHHAWQGVCNTFRNHSFLQENLALAKKVCTLAENCRVKRVVALGSQAEYGPHNKPLKETDHLVPTTIYGKEKDICRNFMEKRCYLKNIELTWVRVFSTYGPYDNPAWLIPCVINSYLKNIAPKLTLGEQQWDFLFSEDAARALIALAKAAPGIYNLGAGKNVSIQSVVTDIFRKMQPSCLLKFGEKPYGEDQIFFLQADITKIQVATGWIPQVSLSQGLDQAIAYYSGKSQSILLNQ